LIPCKASLYSSIFINSNFKKQMATLHNPAHPGAVLHEYIPENLKVGSAANQLAVSRQALSAILNGRSRISADMALRLAGALGTSAEMWLEMQIAWDLWQARQNPPPKIKPFKVP